MVLSLGTAPRAAPGLEPAPPCAPVNASNFGPGSAHGRGDGGDHHGGMVGTILARWTGSAASAHRRCLPRAPGPELRCPQHSAPTSNTQKLTPPPKTSTTSQQPPSFPPGTHTLLFLLVTLWPPWAGGQCWGGDGAGEGTGLATQFLTHRQPLAPQSGQFPSLTGGWRVREDPGDTGVTHLALPHV